MGYSRCFIPCAQRAQRAHRPAVVSNWTMSSKSLPANALAVCRCGRFFLLLGVDGLRRSEYPQPEGEREGDRPVQAFQRPCGGKGPSPLFPLVTALRAMIP